MEDGTKWLEVQSVFVLIVAGKHKSSSNVDIKLKMAFMRRIILERRKTLMAWSSLLLSFSTLSFWRSPSSSFPLFSRSMRSLRSRLSLSCGSSVSHIGMMTLPSKQVAHFMTEPEHNTHPSFSSQYPGTSFSFFAPHPPSSSFLQSPVPCAL